MSYILEGKKKRNELTLPTLHYIVTDDWMDKLGDSFQIWLKLHTFVKRDVTDPSEYKIPMSLEKTWEKLGLSKTTFYRKIKPLWEYGLIDFIEYESERKSQKPKNIIVYDYPFNEFGKQVEPLKKVRDWKKDNANVSVVSGAKGGRPKRVDELSIDGFKNETVDGFKNETVTVSKMKPNNVSNNSSNVSNNSSNVSNLSIYKKIETLNILFPVKQILKKKIDRLIKDNIDVSVIELIYYHYLQQHQEQEEQYSYYFANVLDRIFTYSKKPIKDIRNVIHTTITRDVKELNDLEIKQKSPTKKQIKRKEMLPEWLLQKNSEENQQEEQEQQEKKPIDIKDTEIEKAEEKRFYELINRFAD